MALKRLAFSDGSAVATQNGSHMKRSNRDLRMPQHDYGLALQNAVTWLGQRYLLAEPVARRVEERKPFFVESRSWLEPRRARR
jgi:hypothetical protein